MMLGYFPGKIRKGKLKIPKKFRSYFENRAVLITNPDEGCLSLEVADNASSKEKPIYRTTITKGTLELPSWLRLISGVYSDEVIVMGLIGNLEIWDKTIWKQMVRSQEDYEAFRFSRSWDRANEILRSIYAEQQQMPESDPLQRELKEAYLDDNLYRYFYFSRNFNGNISSWSIIKAFFKKWQYKILASEELDKKLLEKKIVELYKLSGYDSPLFVWCPSPLSLALTFIISKLIELEEPTSTFLLWSQIIDALSLPPFSLKDKARKKFLDTLIENLAKVRKRERAGEIIKHDLMPYEEIGYILDYTPFLLSTEDISNDHEVKKKFRKIFFSSSPYCLPKFELNIHSERLQEEYDKVLVGRPCGIAVCYHRISHIGSALKVGFQITSTIAFLEYLVLNDVFPSGLQIRAKLFLSIAENGVPFIPCSNVCFICEKPVFLETYPVKVSGYYPETKIWLTARFKDGFTLRQDITSSEFFALQSLYAKFCNIASALSYLKERKTEKVFKSFSEVVDTFGDYELLVKEFHVQKNRMMRIQALKMKCPSTGEIHYELVPPYVRTCKEALSWRVGGLEWNPEEHT